MSDTLDEIKQLALDVKMTDKSIENTLIIYGYHHDYALWTKKEIEDAYKFARKDNDAIALEVLEKLQENRKIFDKVKNLLLTRKIERNPRRSVKDQRFLNWLVQFEKHIDKIIKIINANTKLDISHTEIVPIEKYPSIPKYVYEKIAYLKLLILLYTYKVEHFSAFSKNKVLVDLYNQLLDINKTSDDEMEIRIDDDGLLGPDWEITSWYDNMDDILQLLDHYYHLSANIQEFTSFTWLYYNPNELIVKLALLEHRVQGKTSKAELKTLYKNEEPLRKLFLNTTNPNLKWFSTNLGSQYECASMKHCGSTGPLFKGEVVKILSLREYDSETAMWIPRVTAMSHSLANQDNNFLKSSYYKFNETPPSNYYQFLTEIKGPLNELPDKKYWKYILELFHDERILFQIPLHGYKPENNFVIYKLPKLSFKNFVSSSKGYFFDKLSKLKASPLWSHHVELLDKYNERVHVKKDRKKKDKKLLKKLFDFPEERDIIPPKLKKKIKRKVKR